jgi:hypothetical protein
MSCCGNKRQAFKAWLTPRPVRLRFLGAGSITLKGAFTGNAYMASESSREIEVDPRDAGEFVLHGAFVRA